MSVGIDQRKGAANKTAKQRLRTSSAPQAVSDRRRTTMRSQIQAAATRLFFDYGFEATTIRMIADACGITPGAVYNHFDSKEELLYCIVTEGIAETEAAIGAALAGAGSDPRNRLQATVAAFVQYHAEHQRMALVASAEFRSLPEPRLSEVKKLRLQARGIFESIVDEGQRSGVFSLEKPQGVAPERLAAIAIGDMCIRVAEWFDPKGPLKLEETKLFYSRLALRMVGAKPVKPAPKPKR